ncbi:hypothetical protein LTR86_008296 [Recurvomyces mirabilis]|nr:hypothetical protein LTR86_008296 [Recurvomyces mirabilis]
MRFSRRTAQDRGATTSDDVLQLGDTALPQKAELLLGAKTRLGRRGSQQPNSREYGGEDEYKTARPQFQLPDIRQDSQSLLDEMLDPRGRLNVWPNLEQDKKRQEDTLSMRVYQPTGRPSINPRTTSSGSSQGHYDRSKEPLYVTQQTSASAVRDMGLRKPPPMTIHETSSDPNLGRRPLKSAMKKPSSPESTRKPTGSSLKLKSSPSKKMKRLDLSQLFPPPRSSSRNALAAPNLMMPRAGSDVTDDSDFPSPAETVRVELRKPAQNARYETFKRPAPAAAPATRPKVFEKDIYDSAKVNVRRPPKGIQNWFDGFDISSDEEEHVPEQKVRVPGKSGQKPVQEPEAHNVAVDFGSPWHIKSDREQPRLDRKLSKDPVEDNLLAIHHAKERIQERMRQIDIRKGSIDSGHADATTIASVVSSEMPRRPGGESRLAMLDLPSQSALSMSDSDEEESAPRHGRIDMETLSAMSIAGSTDHTNSRQHLQRQRSFPAENVGRASTSTVQTMQTSGSIPIRLTASIPLPAMPTVAQSPPQVQSRRSTQTSLASPTTQALRQLTGQDQLTRARRSTKMSHQDFETFNSGESISSAPTDGSHLMAVSEEEMILLELMRNKRAAMQKNSFTEGYQLALKREQDALLRRRESAQQTALKILQQREEKTSKSRPGSKIVNTGHSSEPSVDYELRRKLSAIKKEDVDKALKMNKFLADISDPTVDNFPEPPSRGQTPAMESKRPPQKFELLMPSVYSPTPSKTLDAYSPVSAEDSSPPPEFEDIEDHHESLRQFLASSSASENLFGNAGVFPTPPSRSRNPSRRDYRVSAVWSPSPVAEEEGVEEGEQDADDAYASSHDKKERRNSVNGRRLSRQYDVDLEAETEPGVPLAMRHKSAMPHPLRQGGQTAHSPYHLHPHFDFTPLEFSPSQLTASPATSISPWTPEAMNFPAPASEKPTIEGAYSSDNASLRNRAYTPDTDLTSLSASGQTNTPASSRKHGMSSRKAPPRLDKIVGHGMRGPESASITSAGEDVLAAWAELGGGTEALVSRRRMR